MKSIEVIVSPLGKVKIETKGFAGNSGRKASKYLEQALGVKATHRPARSPLDEMLYPQTDNHYLGEEQMQRLAREVNAAAAEEPDANEVKAVENIVEGLTSLRERTELLRGKTVNRITVTLFEDFSGYLLAELLHGKHDVDAPNELCACLFCGPEQLLDLLRGRETGQWFLQDECEPCD